MTGSPLLRTTNLSMHFGGVKALNDIDFSLAEGELRCLIGPNGAGKSTFFKCLTGQLTPTTGEIRMADQSLDGLNTSAISRCGVGIKTQVPNVFDGLSVFENVWVAVRSTTDKRQRNTIVSEILEKIGISGLADKMVGQIAHGQRQFVELAMVIAEDPKLILLDEPAAGLSADESKRLAAIIKDLNRDHALIVVEHDMQFIRMIGQKVTVFHQGQILIEDDTEAILRNQKVRDVYLGKKAA